MSPPVYFFVFYLFYCVYPFHLLNFLSYNIWIFKSWRDCLKKILFVIVLALCCSSTAFPASERELFENGVNFLKQDKNQEAVDSFTALIEMAPQNPNAYKNRGVAHMKLNQYDAAINDFEQVKKILPDLKGLYSNLGVAWYYKKDYTRAIENYDKEISLSPDNHFAYFNRAICRAELKEYGASLKDINKTLELVPKFYLALCLKGDLHTNINQPQKAKQAYEQAILIEPDKVYAEEKLESLIQRQGPMAETQKESSPASTIASTLSENYELQTGAFQVQDNALLMQKKLEKNGYTARILEFKRPQNTTWYLVRTGVYSRPETAESFKEILKNNMGIDAIIRPYDRF
jgi:tetratricopeptide (TPR) repeat protein